MCWFYYSTQLVGCQANSKQKPSIREPKRANGWFCKKASTLPPAPGNRSVLPRKNYHQAQSRSAGRREGMPGSGRREIRAIQRDGLLLCGGGGEGCQQTDRDDQHGGGDFSVAGGAVFQQWIGTISMVAVMLNRLSISPICAGMWMGNHPDDQHGLVMLKKACTA